jgi:threonylcarbamoyladenosine tRNA methylthiotransferase MtaB
VNVYFHTFGCKANQYDTELVRQAFADQGAVVVDDPAAADVAVVNSCTVTAESEAKLRRFVRRCARRGPTLETVVMGCAAALDDGRIAALPSVRAVVGGADPAQVLRAAGLPSLPVRLAAVRRGGTADRFRGLLKIQDGCDEHCTFCATTIARGANRSRPIAELVEEAKALAEHHAEIVLTGVHIGTYGQDRSTDPGRKSGVEPDPGTSGVGVPRARARGQSTLGDLLEALISAVPSVRFRLSSIEATEVDDTIARLLIEASRHVAAHLHAPLQSGSDRMLKRMGRHWYTARTYRDRIEWLAERLPVFGLGADIIAGFPDESDADHRATVALVDALPFTYLHVFPFSSRPGAAATRLPGHHPPGVVDGRARELRQLGEAKARAHRAARLGRRADGVVSGRGQGNVEVLTEDYLSVYLPSHEWQGHPRFEVTVR